MSIKPKEYFLKRSKERDDPSLVSQIRRMLMNKSLHPNDSARMEGLADQVPLRHSHPHL